MKEFYTFLVQQFKSYKLSKDEFDKIRIFIYYEIHEGMCHLRNEDGSSILYSGNYYRLFRFGDLLGLVPGLVRNEKEIRKNKYIIPIDEIDKADLNKAKKYFSEGRELYNVYFEKWKKMKAGIDSNEVIDTPNEVIDTPIEYPNEVIDNSNEVIDNSNEVIDTPIKHLYYGVRPFTQAAFTQAERIERQTAKKGTAAKLREWFSTKNGGKFRKKTKKMRKRSKKCKSRRLKLQYISKTKRQGNKKALKKSSQTYDLFH